MELTEIVVNCACDCVRMCDMTGVAITECKLVYDICSWICEFGCVLSQLWLTPDMTSL